MTIIRLNRLEKVTNLGIQLFGETQRNCVTELMRNIALRHKGPDDKVLYHDFNHLAAVALRADLFAQDLNLCTLSRQTLFIAAMFHDICHSFGEETDIVNITTAMYEIQRISKMNFYKCIAHLDVDEICHAIMCTIYPFKIRPTNDIECCLRDADLCMSLEEDADMFAIGLQNEFANKGVIMEVTVTAMRNFAEQQRFYTIECAKLFGINYAYLFKQKKAKS